MIRNSKGLTLVELMIVVIIIGIMAAMAIPLMSGSRTRLKSAARDIVSDLQVARLNAMRDGQSARWRVDFDTVAKQYTVSERTAGAVTVVTSDDVYALRKTVKLSNFGKNVVFGTCAACGLVSSTDDTGTAINTVIFKTDGGLADPAGGSNPTGGTIYVHDQNSNETLAVSVSFATGRVHTRTHYGKGWSK